MKILYGSSIGDLKDERAIPTLVESLSDNYDDTRETAAWALGETNDPATIDLDPLVIALQDSDEEVGQAVSEALAKLGWKG